MPFGYLLHFLLYFGLHTLYTVDSRVRKPPANISSGPVAAQGDRRVGGVRALAQDPRRALGALPKYCPKEYTTPGVSGCSLLLRAHCMLEDVEVGI
jgi:hypothetical protein